MKKQVQQPIRTIDFESPHDLELFRQAAKEFTAFHTRTPEAALKQLVKEGIYTKSGRLTKNYR